MQSELKRRSTTALAAVFCTLTLAASSSHAAADAVLNFTGNLTGSTCTLSISEGGTANTIANPTKTINMGGFSTTSLSGSVNTKFGPEKQIVFTLKDATGTATCTSVTSWSAMIGLSASDIVTLSTGVTALANTSTAATKTNARLLLMDASGAPYALKPDGSSLLYLGKAATTSSLLVLASFIYGADGSPTEGEFKATVPFTLIYP